MTHLVFLKLRTWVFRKEKRGNKMRRKALRSKYFPPKRTYFFHGKRRAYWVFVGKKTIGFGKTEETFLPYLTWISNLKHVKVRSKYSPFNPDSAIYWNNRLSKYNLFPTRIKHLLRVQRGKCIFCKEKFTLVDSKNWEVDHKIPRSAGGKDTYDSLQLLHKSCHIKKSRMDRA